MAIVGKKSLYKNKNSKESPMKIWGAVIGAAVSMYQGSKNRKAAKKREGAARADMERAREAYMELEFTNPYEGLENPYLGMENQFSDLENKFTAQENQFAGLQNQFSGLENQYAGLQNRMSGLGNVYEGMENVYEEGLVDTRAADYAREQRQQQLANTMAGLSGAAGTSGVAALAQSLAGAETQAARAGSLDIARQQRESEMARRGEAARIQGLQRGEQGRLQQLAAGEASRLDQLRAGETSRLQQMKAGETARLQGLTAQEQARLSGQVAQEEARLQWLSAAEAGRIDQLIRSGDFQVDMLDRQGQQYVMSQEQRRIESMYGLTASNYTASMGASQMADAQQSSNTANAISAVANLYDSGAFSSSTTSTTASNQTGPLQADGTF